MKPDEFIRRYGLAEAFSLLCSDTLYIRNGKVAVKMPNGTAVEVSFNGLSEMVKSHQIVNRLGGVVPALEQVLTYERLQQPKRAAELQAHIDKVKVCL